MTTQLNSEFEPLLYSSTTFRNRKVWYKTASPYFLLPPFMILTITYGLGMATKIQFYLRVVCYDYYSKKGQIPPDDYPDEWCNNADIQSITSQFLMILELCSAVPAILVLGPLGSLSDRKGRKIILLMPIMGAIFNSLNIILVGEKLGYYALLIGPLMDGFLGGILLLATATYAYATDCTSPTQRNVIFGWIQGSVYAGLALGPMIGGWIAEITNNLLSVFYVMFVINIVMFLFVLLILPESSSEESLFENSKIHQENLNLSSSTNRSWFLNNSFFSLIYNIFKPLTIFFPSNSIISDDNKINTKYSLLILTIINTIFSAAVTGIMVVLLLYVTLVFRWSLVEQGYYLFMFGISRVFVLFILFPILVPLFKEKILLRNSRVRNYDDDNNEIIVEEDDGNLRKEFIFEVWILRLSLLIDTLAYTEFGLTASSSMFIGATLAASLGAAVIPTIKSLQTNLVAPSQIGQLLGALSVLESITRIISPILFNSLYSILVKTSPNLIWYGISTLLAIALLFSFGVVPNKHN